MPTVLFLQDWRLHFYSNECEAYAYNLSARDTREVHKIILQHFDDKFSFCSSIS